MNKENSQHFYSQRQLRVGELVKQNLGELFIRNEAKIPTINSKLITVTEVRMTPDLKTARAYVIPLGGIEMSESEDIKYFAWLTRSKRTSTMKFQGSKHCALVSRCVRPGLGSAGSWRRISSSCTHCETRNGRHPSDRHAGGCASHEA